MNLAFCFSFLFLLEAVKLRIAIEGYGLRAGHASVGADLATDAMHLCVWTWTYMELSG